MPHFTNGPNSTALSNFVGLRNRFGKNVCMFWSRKGSRLPFQSPIPIRKRCFYPAVPLLVRWARSLHPNYETNGHSFSQIQAILADLSFEDRHLFMSQPLAVIVAHSPVYFFGRSAADTIPNIQEIFVRSKIPLGTKCNHPRRSFRKFLGLRRTSWDFDPMALAQFSFDRIQTEMRKYSGCPEWHGTFLVISGTSRAEIWMKFYRQNAGEER